MTKKRECEFVIIHEYDYYDGCKDLQCKKPAVYELCIGADGDHWLYLCAEHRPSYDEC